MFNSTSYNAIYVLWEGFGFPNSTQPSPGAEPLSFEEWFTRLETAGVTRLRTKFCGWNEPLSTRDAKSFEPGGYYDGWTPGQFNDWGGRLEEAVEAALRHNITFQVIPFDNVELRSGWSKHAWNQANPGGFLSDPRKVFSDPRAIQAAKDRIDAIADACGSVIGAWEICAEMTFLINPGWWQVDGWPQMKSIVREILVPWVEEMARKCKDAQDAPVGNGQVFAPAGFDANPDHPSRLRNEVYMTPSLDFALINWYGDQPVRRKLAYMRACQLFIGKPIYVEQYAPWDLGQNAPYEREPADYSQSREHEWTAATGEYGSVGPSRWPEIKPTDEFQTWWGVASPEMAEIAGTTRWFSEVVDLANWSGRGKAWEQHIASLDLAWASAWGDGAHVTAFLTWAVPGSHRVTIGGLENQAYEVLSFDWLNGDMVSQTTATAESGVLSLENMPQRDNRTVLYISPTTTTPPDPEPKRTMRVTLEEMLGDEVVSTWSGDLEKVE